MVEARAFVRGEFTDVEIGLDVEAGKILAVKKTLPGADRARYPGRLLVPSGIDLHVHFRDPGSPKKEDFHTGTRGAALGGIGAVLDMPNTDPVVDRPSRLEEKRERIAPKACVDWGLWATLTAESKGVTKLLAAAHGLKLFLAPTTGIDDPGSAEDLEARLNAAQTADRLVALHAEMAPTRPADDLEGHDATRPLLGEVAALEAAASLAPAAAAVHLAHASSADALDAAARLGFSAGVTPHHLLLARDFRGPATHAKANPPLRAPATRQALWDRLADGRVPLLETDHAPHTLEEKSRPFRDAPAGLPGVETAYPLLLRVAKERRVPPAPIIRAFSEGPAARLGLARGRIEAGHDANFFLFDPRATHKIRGSELASPCGWTPFEGWESYRVETHYLHGEVVVDDHRFVGQRGRGRPLSLPPASRTRAEWDAYVAAAAPPPKAKAGS